MSTRLLIDIETYRNFFFIGIKQIGEDKRYAYELSDRKPEGFKRDFIRNLILNKPTATFNGSVYDIPVLMYACTELPTGEFPTNSQIKDVSDRIIQGNVKYWQVEDVVGNIMPKPWDYDHIDLVEPQPNPFASLKILNGRLHGKQMQDLPYEPDRILSHDEMDRVAHYCLQNDLDASENLWNAMREAIDLRVALGADVGIDLRSKSDTQVGLAIIKNRAEKLLGRRIQRSDPKPGTSFQYKAPSWISFDDPTLRRVLEQIQNHTFITNKDGKVDLPKWLRDTPISLGSSTYTMGIGGLHSTESNRAVLSDEDGVLVDADVASYYPQIILSLGLYPEAIGREFLDVYRGIRDDRIVAKKAGVKYKDKGLKTSLNGTFGSFGSRYSFAYAPHLMISVTLTGQLALLTLIERAEAAGVAAVSGNTDGVVFKVPRDEYHGITGDRLNGGVLKEITENWERETGFTLEFNEYEALYNQSVNSYFAIKPDGRHKRKGPLANPWSADKSENDLIGQMTKNPQMTICSDAALYRIKHGTPLRETIEGCRDIKQFVTVIKASKGATWRDGYLGKTIRYYWSVDGDPIFSAQPNTTGNFNKIPKTDGARECMRLPDEFPDDIDYDRYVLEAETILKELGFYGSPEKQKRIRLTKKNKFDVLGLWVTAA